MKLEELQESLRTNVIEVKFIKSDGSIRTMKVTTKPDLLPVHVPKLNADGTVKQSKINDEIIKFYSIEDKGWRSMRKDSFISAEIQK